LEFAGHKKERYKREHIGIKKPRGALGGGVTEKKMTIELFWGVSEERKWKLNLLWKKGKI